MTIDKEKLKALAEAGTPGRHYDRLESAGGGIKYECTGDDGSLVLKVDHKNNEFGFVGDRGEADEAFFLACSPATILALLAEIERLDGCDKAYAEAWEKARSLQSEMDEVVRERYQLKAENDALREDLALAKQAPLYSTRQDGKRYRWLIRRISKSQYHFLGAELTSNTEAGVDAAIDAAMAKEASHE